MNAGHATAPGDSAPPPPGPPPEAGRIVIVDDEVELVRTLGAILRSEFGPGRVRDTDDSREAYAWIERERPGVLVTDVRMPGRSGLELIGRSRELWGPVPTVVMTAFPTPEVRSGATSGTFVYLPKPFPVRALIDAVRELEARPAATFRGAIAVSTLADLVQLYAASGATGALSVAAGARRGQVWFDAGQIVHARIEGKEGFEAFCDLVRWPHGSFAWRARRAEVRTIEMHASELLLEAYRVWDEARLAGGGGDGAAAGAVEDAGPPAAGVGLARLRSVEGFIGACLVDGEGGTMLEAAGGDGRLDLAVAAAANSEVVRTKREAMRALALDDEIEDLLFTLGRQYHLIRPLRSRAGFFLYLAIERGRANLAAARMALAEVEKALAP